MSSRSSTLSSRELHVAFGALVLCAFLGFSQEGLVLHERFLSPGATEALTYGFHGVRYENTSKARARSEYDTFSVMRKRVNPDASKSHRFMQRAGALFWLLVISFLIALPCLSRRFTLRQRAGFLLLSAGLGLLTLLMFRGSVSVDPFAMAKRFSSRVTLMLTGGTRVMVCLWACAMALAGSTLGRPERAGPGVWRPTAWALLLSLVVLVLSPAVLIVGGRQEEKGRWQIQNYGFTRMIQTKGTDGEGWKRQTRLYKDIKLPTGKLTARGRARTGFFEATTRLQQLVGAGALVLFLALLVWGWPTPVRLILVSSGSFLVVGGLAWFRYAFGRALAEAPGDSAPTMMKFSLPALFTLAIGLVLAALCVVLAMRHKDATD